MADTLVDVLAARALEQPDKRAFRFLIRGESDGPVDRFSYGALWDDAIKIGAYLQRNHFHKERALLLFPPGLDFVRGFFGCVCGGAIAVPSYPPDPGRPQRIIPRLEAIVGDARARLVLTTAAFLPLLEEVRRQTPALASLGWVAVKSILADADSDG